MLFRYTILYVENVPNALEFYRRAFGFDTLFMHEAEDYGELKTGETKLAFSSRTLMQQLGKSPQIAQASKPTFELAFETDDVPLALASALAAGATQVQACREESWGQSVAYVADPDGYLIEICSPIGQ